jgi:hypothetical protein
VASFRSTEVEAVIRCFTEKSKGDKDTATSVGGLLDGSHEFHRRSV